ncbi:Uncharacterized protein TCAP_04587, partial [Tolypocladium capitatum]
AKLIQATISISIRSHNTSNTSSFTQTPPAQLIPSANMKYTAALSIFALAGAAMAAPTDIEARTPGGPPSAGGCTIAGTQQVCCSGLLSCAVQIIGSSCTNAYCCSTDAPVGALVNIALLNCLAL